MSFVFKKQVLGLLDLIRFKKLVPNRRERFKNGSDSPLPKTYKVKSHTMSTTSARRTASILRITL